VTRTFVDIHVLQTVPPSNLNRDDTGSPKTAVYGGARRSRVSSQAWKRATRIAFSELLDQGELGVRTKRLGELLAERIEKLAPDLGERAAELAVETFKAVGLKVGDPDKGGESGYLVFLSARQIDNLAEAAVAAARDINVDAAAQVAHAISVHPVDNEYDYYTAVDDRKEAVEETGAGMIGTVEFNSATLYRYATVDVDRLGDNLGDPLAVRRALEAFLRAFVTSMPSGKQNTFANRTLPDAVVVMLRDTQPVSFVVAFEEPVLDGLTTGRVRKASERLAEYAADVEQAYGARPVRSWVVRVGDRTKALAGLGDEVSVDELVAAVGAETAARLGSRP
jgi:CRISPR system Cascade subunit CasC